VPGTLPSRGKHSLIDADFRAFSFGTRSAYLRNGEKGLLVPTRLIEQHASLPGKRADTGA